MERDAGEIQVNGIRSDGFVVGRINPTRKRVCCSQLIMLTVSL